MKVYINTDLEGISSFVDWREADLKTGRGLGYTKEFLTAEVNSAIAGVLEVDGKAEFVVQDGHGGGFLGPNLVAEKLDRRARLIQGKRGFEIVGLDSSFDLFFLIGAHAMAGTKDALMDHTINDDYHNVWFNGVKVGEIGISAAIAGYFGVPVAFVSGDYWAVQEARQLLGDVETAAVKTGINRYAADCLHPEVAREMIGRLARQAALRCGEFKPFRLDRPVEIKVEYAFTHLAHQVETRKGGMRIDGRTVIFKDEDFLRAFTMM